MKPVKTAPHPNLYVGLSGIALPWPKYKFPVEFQDSSRLAYYASFFNSIEVNSSFYKLPQKRTVEKWADTVPKDFRYTFKFPRDVSHQKDLLHDKRTIEDFFEVIENVKDKKACILMQFPPGLKSSSFNEVKDLLSEVKDVNQSHNWRIAVEFRDSGWYEADILDLLKDLNFSLVIQDIPKSAAPLVTTSEEFVYVRFHGPTGNYRESYTDEFLQEYAGYVRDWLSEGKNVYVYFNNTAGSAFDNLRTMQRLLA